METFGAEELRALLHEQGGPHVSIYMPMEVGTRAAQKKNTVQFENLLSEARARLAQRGVPREALERLLEQAEQVRGDDSLWEHPEAGLAVFLAPGYVRHQRAPLRFPERLHVGERFHTKPLLPLVAEREPFYVLALSKGAVRLFRAGLGEIVELFPAGLPRSFADALRLDSPGPGLQSHSLGGARAGRAGDILFHGQGSADLEHDELGTFCQRVNQALRPLLAAERPRLVLASVEELWPLYRAANTCTRLVEGIRGNPDQLAAHELLPRAREVLATQDDRVAPAVAAFERLAQPERASDSPEIVVPAAVQGRVNRLLVAGDRELWGRFDPGTQTVQRLARPEAHSEDLSDLAAAQTWLHGGDVLVVPFERMPRRAVLAALFRY